MNLPQPEGPTIGASSPPPNVERDVLDLGELPLHARQGKPLRHPIEADSSCLLVADHVFSRLMSLPAGHFHGVRRAAPDYMDEQDEVSMYGRPLGARHQSGGAKESGGMLGLRLLGP